MKARQALRGGAQYVQIENAKVGKERRFVISARCGTVAALERRLLRQGRGENVFSFELFYGKGAVKDIALDEIAVDLL